MTDTRPSTIAREVLLGSTTITTSASVLAREVLLSQVTQTWASAVVREVLLFGNPQTARNYAVTVSVA